MQITKKRLNSKWRQPSSNTRQHVNRARRQATKQKAMSGHRLPLSSKTPSQTTKSLTPIKDFDRSSWNERAEAQFFISAGKKHTPLLKQSIECVATWDCVVVAQHTDQKGWKILSSQSQFRQNSSVELTFPFSTMRSIQLFKLMINLRVIKNCQECLRAVCPFFCTTPAKCA